MTDERYAKRKHQLTLLIQAAKSSKHSKAISKDVSRIKKTIKAVAKRLGIEEKQVLAETVMSVMCCDTHIPKVKFDTLSKAAEIRGGVPYPCHSCLTWHCTTTCYPEPPDTFLCPGCNLTYVLKHPHQKHCCKGCRKKCKKMKN